DVVDHELLVFFFQAEDGIRDRTVTGVQTCALPILMESFEYPTMSMNSTCAISSAICLLISLGMIISARARRQFFRNAHRHAADQIGRASCRERVWGSGAGAV